MERTITYCDLCQTAEINPNPSDSGLALILGDGSFQLWPDKAGENRLVCWNCCILLAKADAMGLISMDREALYQAIGFKKGKRGWKMKHPVYGKITILDRGGLKFSPD